MTNSIQKPHHRKDGTRPAAGGTTQAPTPRFDYHSVALVAVLVLIAGVRLRLLAVPFERDEGEYAYMGNLILHGGLPYRDAYNMKLPGTYGMYSLIMAVFGSSPAGIHAGFMLLSLATIALMFVVFKRLFSPMTGLVAATVYGLLSVSSPMLGFAAHATHFVNFFVLLGLLFYSRWNERRPWLQGALTGLMFGLAFLMKQHAVFLVVFGGLIVLVRVASVRPWLWKEMFTTATAYVVAAAIPYGIVAVVLAANGAFGKFWFWTVTYATAYASAETPWNLGIALFDLSFRPIFMQYPIVWLLALAGLVAVWVAGYDLRQKLLVTSLAVFSTAAVLPGLNFREHYFVLLLPAVGVSAAITLEFLTRLIPSGRGGPPVRALPFVAVAAMGIFAMATDRAYYLDAPPDEVSRKIYAGNPFVEARTIGARIASDTTAGDTIAILGSEPEILVYAGRQSATRYLYVYPLVEPQPDNVRMQREMMREIEAAQPRYLLYCNVATSWLATPQSPTGIREWFNRYAPAHYDIVGIIEIGSGGVPSEYFWDAEARRRAPGPNSVWVLRRKGE